MGINAIQVAYKQIRKNKEKKGVEKEYRIPASYLFKKNKAIRI